MRRLFLLTALLLPVSIAHAQTSDEVVDQLDTALFCATAFAMALETPDLPADKAEHYGQASEDLFAGAYVSMTQSGMPEAKIDEIAKAYLDEVTAAISSNTDMRLSETDCDAAHAAISG